MNKPETPALETDLKMMDSVIDEKLQDMETPGFQAEFDPLEAERLGAFEESALSEQDALDSTIDQLQVRAK